MKTCTKCKIEKPIGDFNKVKASKDGYAWHCRLCMNVRTDFLPVEIKQCRKCKVVKSASDFTLDRKSRDGLKYYCRECNYVVSRKHHKEFPEAFKNAQERYYRKNPEYSVRMGLTSMAVDTEVFERMVSDALGVCAICHQDKPLIPDHSHVTGKLRGVLCRSCNMNVGKLGDELAPAQALLGIKPTEFRTKAVAYLAAAEQKTYGTVPVISEGENK